MTTGTASTSAIQLKPLLLILTLIWPSQYAHLCPPSTWAMPRGRSRGRRSLSCSALYADRPTEVNRRSHLCPSQSQQQVRHHSPRRPQQPAAHPSQSGRRRPAATDARPKRDAGQRGRPELAAAARRNAAGKRLALDFWREIRCRKGPVLGCARPAGGCTRESSHSGKQIAVSASQAACRAGLAVDRKAVAGSEGRGAAGRAAAQSAGRTLAAGMRGAG